MTASLGEAAGPGDEREAADRTVSGHYENLLAPVYAWMTGGAEAAIVGGREELARSGSLNGRIAYCWREHLWPPDAPANAR